MRKHGRWTIRIDTPWLNDPDLLQVFAALEAAGGEVRVVGGAVRDHLLGRPIKDIDLVTTLQPPAIMAAADHVGLRTIPTGMDHGTVSILVGGHMFETTTLRADVETNGRHAVVRFTTDWLEDAQRRDLTMNALYLDPRGEVHDPLGQGLADARSETIRFIGTATERIREDYLRILRFFRFHAQLGWPVRDVAGRDACAAEREGLRRLSVERIWQEMRLLLAAPDPGPTLTAMRDLGLLAVIAPEIDAAAALPADNDSVLRLAALIGDRQAARSLARRWKLSRADATRLDLALVDPADTLTSVALVRRAIYRDGRQALADRSALVVARGGEVAARVLAEIGTWVIPAFPVRGADLMQAGLKPGPMLGQVLHEMEERWIAGDFSASRADCLDWLPEVIRGLEVPGSSPRPN